MTQNCSHCGTRNRDTARFCIGCSAPLAELVCPNCGTANSATARFCQQCATPLQNGAVPFRPDTGLLPPQSVLSGRYIILCKVGQGGMAAVYQAADARITGKAWAVKEMSDAAITDPLEKQQAVEAFRREAELLSRLSHPNIPRVTDFFSEGGNQYLVMEFVDGETLEEKLAGRSKPFSESEVWPWAEQLCDVLDYLHNQRPPVIFRDLKPANVMVDKAGRVKLIDFGIVRFFQPGKAKDTVSFGTAGYAPPEQYGKGQTEARSDIYALGATLHHLLTGCDPALKPFQFEPVCRLNPAVSPQMERMVMRAVEQEPTRRWPSAGEMWRALHASPLPKPASPPPKPAAVAAPARPAAAPRLAVSLGLATVELAGFGRRLLAFLIDNLLLYLVYGIFATCPVLLVPDPFSSDEEAMLSMLLCGAHLLFLLLYFWYYVFFQARSGQTLGKKIMGIRIISADGSSPGKGRCFLRFIGYWISSLILYIGFLMPLWDQNKQALHDKMANTYVIRA